MELFSFITGFIALIIGTALLCLTLYMLYITLGYRKGKTAKCKGYLEDTTHHKNYRVNRSVKAYKNYIHFTYIYTVNGKKYRISGGGPGVKGNLSNTITVVYQKRNPKHAHFDGMPIPLESVFTIICFLFCIAFLIYGISHI